MSQEPLVLITNDDGIDSFFLRVLVEAHAEAFRVIVAAPMHEQSWIGRATSRNKRVHVAEYPGLPCKAYALDGTPSDCVNIAIAHLLKERPDLVVSGINLGFNASLPLVLSSGTVAGALEGAFWRIPSLAFSHQVPHEQYESLRHNHGHATGGLRESLFAAGRRAVDLSRQRIGERMDEPIVWNVNFPCPTTDDTALEETLLCRRMLGPLFEQQAPIAYGFRYSEGETYGDFERSDAAALKRGNLSLTKINFGNLG